MKVLFLYPNTDGYFRCPVGLTLIMTILAKEGHDVKVFDTTFMAVEDSGDNQMREKLGIVKKVPTAHLFEKQSTDKIISTWVKTVQDFKPDLIGASIMEDAYSFCGDLLDAVKKKI